MQDLLRDLAAEYEALDDVLLPDGWDVPTPTDRLRHIALPGSRAIGFSHVANRREPPEAPIRFEPRGPGRQKGQFT